MVETKYDNGVLICANHGTTISKRNGKFYCVQCQHNKKPVCTPIDFLSPGDRVRIENYQASK